MADDERRLPTTNQPLNAEKRAHFPALLAVIALFAVVAAVFILITVLRYTT